MYATWLGGGENPAHFFYSDRQRALFKIVISRILLRVNTLTGRRYADEPAVLGWELGNELVDPSQPGEDARPPPAWSEEMAAYIKAVSLPRIAIVVDGGLFAPSALELRGVDMVGSTFYNLRPEVLQSHLRAVEAAAARNTSLSKGYIVKEYGLVSGNPTLNRTLVVEQNATWIEEMVDLCRGSDACVGSLLWSLRPHAEEGGFHWHREEGGDIRALHWPGFSEGGPNFERETFDVLRAANGVPPRTDVAYTPAPPVLYPMLNGTRFAVPCLGFAGSTGAEYYELWGNSSASPQWLVVTEAVNDTLRPRSSAASVAQSILISRLGSSGDYSFCLRACTGVNASRFEDLDCHVTAAELVNQSDGIGGASCRHRVNPRCSECSAPVSFSAELPLPGVHPACAGITFAAFDTEIYYADLLSSYFAHTKPEESVFIVLGLAVAGTALLLCAVARRMCRCWQVRRPPKQLADTSQPHSSTLDALRLLSVVGIVGHHLVSDLGLIAPPRVHAALSIGVACYPMLFLLAGHHAATRATDEEVSRTVRVGFSRMYPAFLVTAVIGAYAGHTAFTAYLGAHGYTGTSARGAITGLYILMVPFCAGAWHQTLRLANVANAPSFIVGALLFDGAFAPPILSRLRGASNGALATTLVAALAASIWQAANDMGITVLVVDRYVTFLALGPSMPSYVFGLTLGEFSRRPLDGVGGDAWWAARHCGLSLLLLVAACACALAPPHDQLQRHLAAWLRTGACLPLFGAAVVSAAAGRDVLVGPIGVHLPRVIRGTLHRICNAWLQLLLCAHPAWRVAQLLVGMPINFPSAPSPLPYAWATQWAMPPPPPVPVADPRETRGTLAVFAALLLLGVMVLELLVVPLCAKPCERLLQALLTDGLTVPQRAWGWERLMAYYGVMACIWAAFLVATLQRTETEWALLADIRSATRGLQRVLELSSWLLVAPSVALLMGLLGQLFFPPCVHVPTPPIPKTNPTEHELSELPVLFWRIVTRGLQPDLVAANVCDAFAVLNECGLPSSRWAVEVVTDNAMDLRARTRTDVVELVVPSSYKPPNGCKFKARALHYAAVSGCSDARRHDWLIHMDEETRFDSVTVAHVLDHIMHEHAKWAAGSIKHGAIGQGVILYNAIKGQAIESTACALADTIRVGDDYGKFALQYRVTAQPLIGMHGSFVGMRAHVCYCVHVELLDTPTRSAPSLADSGGWNPCARSLSAGGRG